MQFIIIPECVLSYPKLNAMEKLVVGMIYSLTRTTEECFATNRYFANKLGCSTRTISSAISSIKREGFIVTRYIDKRRRIFLTEKFNKMIEK